MVKTILDLTYPITSMFSGTGFNSSISNIFKDRQIEVCPQHTWLALAAQWPWYCLAFSVFICPQMDREQCERRCLLIPVLSTGPVAPLLCHHHRHHGLCHAGSHRW